MNHRLQNRLFVVLRYVLLLGLLAFVSFQVFAHGLGNKIYPSIHGLCPFGGLESLLAYVAYDGATLGKIFSGTMALFFVFLILTLLFRRAFCGLLCPFGTMQELFGNLGVKLFGRRLVMPYLPDRVLRYAKYVVLLITVAMAWLTGTLWFQTYDPWTAFGHILSLDELLSAYLIGFIVLLVTLVGSFFYDRFFCKYFCPLGAVNAILGKFSRLVVRRDAEACINCSLCSQACPANIDVEHELSVTSAECLSCGKCVAACPKKGALDFKFWRWTISPLLVLALVAALYFGGIAWFQAVGYDRYAKQAEATLRELAQAQGLSVEDFKARFDLPASLASNTPASDVEAAVPFSKMAELNGLAVQDLKTQLGLPAELDDQTPWGDAYGRVTLQKIAELNGISLPDLLAAYGLAPETAADTPWQTVREQAEAYLAAAQGSGEGGGCAGE